MIKQGDCRYSTRYARSIVCSITPTHPGIRRVRLSCGHEMNVGPKVWNVYIICMQCIDESIKS